jgi:hypothetical protein
MAELLRTKNLACGNTEITLEEFTIFLATGGGDLPAAIPGDKAILKHKFYSAILDEPLDSQSLFDPNKPVIVFTVIANEDINHDSRSGKDQGSNFGPGSQILATGSAMELASLKNFDLQSGQGGKHNYLNDPKVCRTQQDHVSQRRSDQGPCRGFDQGQHHIHDNDLHAWRDSINPETHLFDAESYKGNMHSMQPKKKNKSGKT